MRLSILLSVIALFAGFASAQPIRVAVAPIVIADPCKFAGPDRESTQQIVSMAALEYLDAALYATSYLGVNMEKSGQALQDLKIDFSKSSDRKADKLQSFGNAVGADYAVLIVVEKTEQKNPSTGAAASGLAKSSNKVRIRLWLHNVAENQLRLDGSKRTYEGEAKGPWFGTVRTDELTGDPTGVGIMIRNEYRKRAEWLGKALVEALRNSLKPTLGLKDP
jgi:hypothetical protein